MTMGRRSKLTPELQDKIIELIGVGNYIEVACAAVGITDVTYYNWMKAGRSIDEKHPDLEDEELRELDEYSDHEVRCVNFFRAAKKAQAQSEAYAVTIVRSHMPDQWTAAMTYLERRFPGRWKRREEREVKGATDAEAEAEQAMLEDPEAVALIHEALEQVARKRLGPAPEALIVDAEVIEDEKPHSTVEPSTAQVENQSVDTESSHT